MLATKNTELKSGEKVETRPSLDDASLTVCFGLTQHEAEFWQESTYTYVQPPPNRTKRAAAVR